MYSPVLGMRGVLVISFRLITVLSSILRERSSISTNSNVVARPKKLTNLVQAEGGQTLRPPSRSLPVGGAVVLKRSATNPRNFFADGMIPTPSITRGAHGSNHKSVRETHRGGRVLNGVYSKTRLLDVKLLRRHLIPLLLVHLLTLQCLHGSFLDSCGGRPLSLFKSIPVLDQFLVQCFDLHSNTRTVQEGVQ